MRWCWLLLAVSLHGQVVAEVKALAQGGDFAGAEKMAAAFKASQGANGEYLEAYSWLGRAALAAKKYDQALTYAGKTREMALALLKSRPVDAEPHLPIGLGASIEVQGQALAARGQRSEAVAFLSQEVKAWKATSMRARIQKNLNLLSLSGQPAPALDIAEWVGGKPKLLASYKGKPVVLFFWAHWCADCKMQGPVLAKLRREFPGLTVLMPTQRYGYVAGGADTTPAAEIKYIDKVRKEFYADLADAPSPVSEENFKQYGSSTSPTLVLVDAAGLVRLYHPGKMTYEELLPEVRKLTGGRG
ncbi:MAG: TlpA family protein disulfide reductase [Bryobacteraceae bacterium]|nr:TlpA family protein disulfide reductase [Bryobacteraceae bacterium]